MRVSFWTGGLGGLSHKNGTNHRADHKALGESHWDSGNLGHGVQRSSGDAEGPEDASALNQTEAP